MNLLKTIGSYFLLWLSAVGSIASIYGIRSDNGTKTFLARVWGFIWSPSFIIVASVVFVIAFFTYLVRNNMKNRGGIRFSKLLWRLNPFAHTDTVFGLHELQHRYCDISKHLQKVRNPKYEFFSDEKLETLLFEFLLNVKRIIDRATNGDVSVHVKIFEPVLQNRPGSYSTNNTVLRSYLRVPSRREKINTECGLFRARAYEEKFSIIPDDSGTADSLFKKETEYRAKELKFNSAYNYLFNRNDHFFLNNNLSLANEQKTFFSTSNDWSKFYRSLVVAAIFPHIPESKGIKREDPYGLFIVDSYEIGAFDNSLIRQITGYVAHRLFDVFDQLATPCEKCRFQKEQNNAQQKKAVA